MYQFDCFGGGKLKPPYCLLFRDLITSLPLAIFWLIIPIYIRIIRKKEPKLRTPKWFWAHLTFQALLIVENATFGALDFNKFDHFLPFLRFAKAISYTSCCIWFCLLSKRLHEIHSSFCISFLVLTILKLVQILITFFESSFDLGDLTELTLLMAESTLLAISKRRETEKFILERPKSPEEKASFISRVFFSWLTYLIRIGAKRPLENEDLYPLNRKGNSEYLKKRWDEEWKNEREECSKTQKVPSIVWPFVRIHKKEIFCATIARALADTIHYLNPILLKQLIDYVSFHDQPLSFGIAIASLMFLSATTRSLLQNFQIGWMCRLSLYYQMVLNSAIMSKILRLSPTARNGRTAGEILNHSAVDTEIISQAVVYLQNMWSVPFQVTLAMIMLSITLGWAALAGVVIMLLFIPLNFFTSRFIKKSQIAQMKVKDERTKLSNEMLNGIKVVKLYAWEESFETKINELRAKEVKMLRNVCILSRIVDVANATSPFLVAIASFTCYVLFASDSTTSLTPSVAFVALTIFNQLRQPMRMVAMLINSFVQAKVSNIRLKEFMNAEEMRKNTQVALGNAVVFKNASLNWKGAQEPAVIKNLSATIKSGQLIAIVGGVGGGKSSILSAILDEMCLLEGKVKVGGSLAYVPQHSWIFNKSIRNNITFGELMGSQENYEQIVEACQLKSDFLQFQQGDETIVGENVSFFGYFRKTTVLH
ncbi:unnamed protein product [Caenorhabditis angaria]|uniref:ABC transmembrane type-1 domain-containing protein n=1 Tax=Caenorhabditis angaria TaxID=860376 RepID=A0A9P1IIS9_9PELO|nr:unnamed protein product [Caenorhabditis angaria]